MNLDKKDYLKLGLLAVVSIAIIVSFPYIIKLYNNLELFIKGAGIFGPMIYLVATIIGILISPIPTLPLAIISGSLFGPFLGLIYTLTGTIIGAMGAFLISRFFLKEIIKKKFGKHKIFEKIAKREDKNLMKLAFFMRLMPYLPLDLASYAFGVTEIRFLSFVIATFFGMIPGVFIMTFFGYLLHPYKDILLGILLVIFISYWSFSIWKAKQN